MKVSCPACDSKYTIADEKVAGRKVKVRCKSCGGQILINGTVPPPPPDPSQANESTDDDATRIYKGGEIKSIAAESAAKDNAEKRASEPAEKSAPTASTEAVADDGIVWSVNVSDNDERSLKTHEVIAGYLSGEFSGEVYVWRDGMDDWVSIPDAPELAAVIEASKKPTAGASTDETKAGPKSKALPSVGKGTKTGETPAPAEAASAGTSASKKQAARAAGAKRPQSAHDLFAAASAAGSEMDVSVSESDEPAQKMTGARNENSVLFSLDALKAGITASPTPQAAPKGKQPPASPRKKLEDLMASGGQSHATANALTLNASQALLMAPAPPPPPPKPEPVIVPSVAPAAAADPLTPKKKVGFAVGIIAAIVGAGVVAGVTFAMVSKPAAPAVSVVAVPIPVPVASTPAATPTPAEAKPAESVAQAETKPAESAESAAAAPKTPSGGPAAVAKVGAGTPAAPAVAAKVEPKKETKRDEPAAAAPASGAGAFSRDAAAQALAVAASQTSICKKPDGPTGQGKVQVTFAPSGRATTANIVSGPFGGTAVGGCVSGVFKRAKVPAFSGDSVTVSKSFTIAP